MTLDEERRLQDLKSERDFIQARPHDRFADATRVSRLDSEIQAFEDHIAREKQRAGTWSRIKGNYGAGRRDRTCNPGLDCSDRPFPVNTPSISTLF
jgi:hypothetical protein